MDIKEILIEWEVILISSSNIHFILILDRISIYFLFLVRLISGSVIIFRTRYMMNEKFFSRFIILVFFFVMLIYLLILRPNLIRLLLGWDGLGVTSYLLVIFYQRNKSYNAGILTAITNRLGDVGLLVSISLLLFLGNWNYIYLSSFSYVFSNLKQCYAKVKYSLNFSWLRLFYDVVQEKLYWHFKGIKVYAVQVHKKLDVSLQGTYY